MAGSIYTILAAIYAAMMPVGCRSSERPRWLADDFMIDVDAAKRHFESRVSRRDISLRLLLYDYSRTGFIKYI